MKRQVAAIGLALLLAGCHAASQPSSQTSVQTEGTTETAEGLQITDSAYYVDEDEFSEVRHTPCIYMGAKISNPSNAVLEQEYVLTATMEFEDGQTKTMQAVLPTIMPNAYTYIPFRCIPMEDGIESAVKDVTFSLEESGEPAGANVFNTENLVAEGNLVVEEDIITGTGPNVLEITIENKTDVELVDGMTMGVACYKGDKLVAVFGTTEEISQNVPLPHDSYGFTKLGRVVNLPDFDRCEGFVYCLQK